MLNIEYEILKIEHQIKNISWDLFELIWINLYETLKLQSSIGTIALVCGGKHTQHLLDDFSELLNTVEIIDKNAKNIQLGNHRIVDYADINRFDSLVISSYEYRHEIRENLIQLNYKGRIIDLYEFLEEKGIDLSREYYLYKDDPYSMIIIANSLLCQCVDREKRREILLAILRKYIENRDLYEAEITIEKYYREVSSQDGTLKNIKSGLQALENNIMEEISQKKTRDIICFWQDDLRYETSQNMSYYNECRANGVDFINAYGSSISTRNTFGCMMEGQDEISLFSEGRKPNQVDDFLENEGYVCYRIGGSAECVLLKDFDYKNAELSDYSVATTKLFWKLIQLLITSSKPVFVIVHSILETHPPFYAPILEDYYFSSSSEKYRLETAENMEKYKNCVKKCAKYLDDENRFLARFLSTNAVKIYMSDHGCVMSKTTRAYNEALAHVPLVVCGKGIPQLSVRGMFTYTSYLDLLKWICGKLEISEIVHEYIRITGIDAYGKRRIDEIIDFGIIDSGIQFTGVRTQQDVYVYRATGDEEYYLKDDENTNLIANIKYQDRIDFLKTKINKKMVDIDMVDKFYYSHKLYNELGKMVELLK